MGVFEKLKKGLAKTKKNMAIQFSGLIASFTGENEDFYDEMEESLILADTGVDTAVKLTENLRALVKERGIRGREGLAEAMTEVMTGVLDTGERELRLETKPSVILMIGVNGAGKTTTAGKIAKKLTQQGKRVLLCAGDTFRAAAAEQLEIWAQRAGADLVKHEEGADPAAVIYDAISAAKARGTDVVICDTAGRLQNKKNLMNELSKIRRVIDRELPDADKETLLVMDATTGQNGLSQAKLFGEAAGLSGIVLTKLDGTAKGGIVFAVADELGIPVKLVGVGEQADDLLPFDPVSFAEALISGE